MGNQVDQQEGFLRSVIASGGISLFCCHNIVLGQYCIQYTTVRAVLNPCKNGPFGAPMQNGEHF